MVLLNQYSCWVGKVLFSQWITVGAWHGPFTAPEEANLPDPFGIMFTWVFVK